MNKRNFLVVLGIMLAAVGEIVLFVARSGYGLAMMGVGAYLVLGVMFYCWLARKDSWLGDYSCR